MIVDVHAHPVSRDLVRDHRNLAIMDRQAACLAATDAVTLLLERMAQGGIDRTCLMGPTPGDGIALTNHDVRRLVDRYPDRLIGFVGVDPLSLSAQQVRACIQEAVTEWGFRGVGELANVELTDPRCEPVFAACVELDVPVLIHTGVPLPSMLLRHGHPFGIDEVANRHPDLKIIAAHLGVPWLLETIAVAVRHPNVYLDISALPAVEKRAVGPLLTLCVDRGLGDRLLFGSDFPLVDPAAYVRRINSVGPAWLVRRLIGLAKITPAVRKAILGGNAARLLKLTPP